MCYKKGFEAKKRVLIADDDAISRRVLRRVLNREYDVLEAENGMEALDILDENPDIAAVLLDLHMPLMDGFELLDIIRGDEEFCHLPVLALSAADVNEAKEQVINAGADDFLIKPIAPGVVLHRLKTAILLQNMPEQDAQRLLDMLPFGIWLFDGTTGCRIYANQTAREVIVPDSRDGSSFDGLIGSSEATEFRIKDVEWKGRQGKLVVSRKWEA
ncbi:response regulator [Ihubacter sp. rT4E-8]|uniref:response regulator n=1 Tax=unclassified Ihubacter TaxID=2633299 RepID=UPI00137B240A